MAPKLAWLAHCAREGGGADRARRASALQRPPISRAMTVSRQRFDLHSSGYVRFLARLAVSQAAPAVRPPALRGRPAAVRGETSVVSTASWAPAHSGRPLAMASMRRLSWRAGSTFKSLTSTLRATAAPASLRARAVARSRGPPLARKMPERGQAARWSPQGSRCARQRHLAEDTFELPPNWPAHAGGAQSVVTLISTWPNSNQN